MPNDQDVTLEVHGEKVEARVVHVMSAEAKYSAAPSRIVEAFYGDELVGKASAQPPIDSAFMQMISRVNCAEPPIPLSKYRELFRQSAMQRACCMTKVAHIVGQGYHVRPRAELFPRVDDWGPNRSKKGPNTKDQVKVLDFLDLPMQRGVSFTELLENMWLDVEVEGQGYLEFSRGGNGGIDGIYHAVGETVRVVKGGPEKGFWQIRGTSGQFFAPYDGVRTLKYGNLHYGVSDDDTQTRVLKAELADMSNKSVGEKVTLVAKAVTKVYEETDPDIIKLNELMMFKKQTPYDIYYGEPDILSAVGDWVVAADVRQYAISYFDNATAPRLLMLIEGDTTLTQGLVNEVEKFLNSKERIDVLQQSLIVQVPGDCKLRVEPVKSARMDESESLTQLREKAEGYIRIANRTPDCLLPGASNPDPGTIRMFTASVVSPAQSYIESRCNWLFASELGVKDWVMDLAIPDLVDESKQWEIWDIGLRRGVLTINEIRMALNRPPVDGGDVPFVLIPGQGAVRVDKVEAMGDAIGEGAKTGDVMATGEMKTPPKGVRPLSADDTSLASMTEKRGKALAILTEPEELPKLSPAERAEIREVLSNMVINIDDIEKVIPV